MSDIKFHCPSCGKKLAIDARAASLMIVCPECINEVRVPDHSDAPQPDNAAVTPAADVPHRPVPFSPPPKSTTVEPPSHPEPLARELQNAKERMAGQSAELRSVIIERDSLRQQIETLRKESGDLHVKMDQDRKSRDVLLGKIGEMEKSIKETTSAASQAASIRDAAEQRSKQLEKQLDELKLRVSDLDKAGNVLRQSMKERDDQYGAAMERIRVLENENSQLKRLKENLTEQVAELKTERAGLLLHKQEAEALNQTLAGLQKQLTEMREQEKDLLQTIKAREETKPRPAPPPQSPEPARSAPWEFSDPFLKMKRWMYVYAGIAACSVLGAILYVMLQPAVTPVTPTPVVIRDKAAATASTAAIESMVGKSVIVDDMEVTLERVRVSTVKLISLLGAESLSDTKYLVMDLKLVNVSKDRAVILKNVWREGKMMDDRGRRLKMAFAGPATLEFVDGMVLDRILKPGESVADLVVFEWDDRDAESFTLNVDPDFRKSTGPETSSQISLVPLTLSFIRADLVEQ